MKTKLLLWTFIPAIGLLSFDILNSNGKAGSSGAPGEGNCTQCHTGNQLNNGQGSVSIVVGGGVNQYTPGQTYSVQVNINRPGALKFGLCLSALQSNGSNAGTLVPTNTNENQILTQAIQGNTRNYMTHKSGGAVANDSKTFTFDWVAPTTDIGTVTFYCAANTANNNGATSGDFIYSTSIALSPESGVGLSDTQNKPLQLLNNPVIGNTLYINGITPDYNQLEVFDMNGKLIFQNNVSANSANVYAIEIEENIGNGIYFLKLNSGKSSQLIKFIKQ